MNKMSKPTKPKTLVTKRYSVNVSQAVMDYIKAKGQFGESQNAVLERLLGIGGK